MASSSSAAVAGPSSAAMAGPSSAAMAGPSSAAMAGPSSAAMAGPSSDAEFEWGDREPGTTSSYQSMSYRGVRYKLHDNVFCRSDLPNPYVGKLMRLFEEEPGVRKVRLRWFFRPYELPIHVFTNARADAASKELYIAVGPVSGAENENLVGVIQGKANVLCTASFSINPMPPQALVDAADFFFYRAYDVAREKLVKMATLDRGLALRLINKLEWVQPPENEQVQNQASTSEPPENEQVQNRASTSEQVQNQASTSEGSTSYTTSKDVNLVRRKHSVSISKRVSTKVKKMKKF